MDPQTIVEQILVVCADNGNLHENLNILGVLGEYAEIRYEIGNDGYAVLYINGKPFEIAVKEI